MDELIRHCLRELSFDGDLGCDVSRLRDFIAGFYERSPCAPPQNVDAAFCAFVWAVVVQQPGVRVGTVPPGASTEVYIAPQVSAARKARAKGEEPAEGPAPATTLDVVPDATIRPLEELKAQYGEGLRIAVDPETTFAAITGSHFRPSKLTPMIYTALQLITRGREKGISVVDLGKKSGYDQKTCFYVIKQLVELDLVVKRRRPGISTNLCVHKYFFEHSPVWRQVVEEEARAQAEDAGGSDEVEQGEAKALPHVGFDPIDARHLSSMPLLRARVVKLLRNSPHHMHTSQNLLIKIGFANPTRTDRRFFRTRLRELMEQGVIEKVQVPHADRKRFPERKVPCIRLLTEDATPQPLDEAEPMEDADADADAEAEPDIAEDDNRLKMNVTIHKQIVDLLDESGTRGMTLNELSSALCDFDRRTVELLLARLEKDPPPPHLSDLGIAQLGETHGRERRYKYYTVAHFLAVAAKEGLEDVRYGVDISNAGGFLPVDASAFYEDEEELIRYVDGLKGSKRQETGGGKAKKRAGKKPTLPGGTIKKGRSRKSVQELEGEAEEAGEAKGKRGKKRKRTDEEAALEAAAEVEEPPPKRKRGRPPKQRHEEPLGEDVAKEAETPPVRKRGRPPKKAPVEGPVLASDQADAGGGSGSAVVAEGSTIESIPAKRGRPPKRKASHTTMDAEDGHERVSPSAEQATPRKRGRPPKKRAGEPGASAIVLDSTAVQGEERPSALQPSVQENIDEDGRPVSPAVGADVSMQEAEDVPPLPSVESISQSNPPERSELSASASAGTAAESLLRRSSRKKVLRHRGDSLSPPRRTRGSRATTVPTVPSQPSSSNVEPPAPVTQDISSAQPEPSASNGNMQVAQTDEHVTAQNQLPENDYIPPEIPIDPVLQAESIRQISESRQDQQVMSISGAGPSTSASAQQNQDVPAKRNQPDTGITEVPAKRAKSSGPSTELTRYRSKTNISQSRREKEVLRVITEAGGIMNTTAKEFYEAHAAVVEAITKAGETASTRPGTRIDKRTLEATLADLESRQKIKLLSTFITSLTGGSRHARIAYLVDTSPDDLNTFLTNLSRNFQYFLPSVVKTLDEPIAYGGANQAQLPAPPSSAITLDRDKDKDRAAVSELLRSSDTVIRESLLTEKNTVAQLYGFIIGKAARARALHTTTMQLFEDGRVSPRIVSSQHRIIQLSYYYHEIPISTYCSLVSCTTQMDELGRLLASADGRQTPVQDIPADIYEVLQPLRSKPRARLFTIIELLLALNLVVPLQPSNSANPAFRCPAIGSHPAAFDVAPTDVWTSFTAPEYWRFNEIAPIRLWALQQDSPPLWKSVSLSSAAQCAAFWEELEKVSVDGDYAKQIICPDVEMESSERVVAAAKCLRRQTSWRTSYCLSWYQMEFLRQYVDTSTGNTPLQDEDGGDARLDHLSWVSSAPRDVLTHYFQKAHKRHVRSVQKLTQKTKRAAVKAEVQEERDTKALLARRAAESKRQREEVWDDMVARVHSEPLRGSAAVRVQRLRSKFLQGSGKDHQLWETRIVDAIREAELAAKQILTTGQGSSITPIPRGTLPPPVATNVPEKAIEDLIAQQGPPLPPKQRTHKSKKAAGSVKDEAAVQRRHRFQWNRDYDELVRDASIVIKARCRGTVRLDWGALEQVFPAVPRNSVRQRFAHLRELTGADAYLKRLEEKWHDLWLEHRGTDILPDDDPASATNFDIVAHIKFLRKHIDKNALRVGFLELSNTKSKAILPTSVDQIDQVWDVVENPTIAPAWDFMWSVVSEEGREKQFAQHSFIAELNEMPAVGAYASESIYIGDSALKMTLGTPHENYDPDSASQLLKSVGERAVQTATKTLLARGAVSKTVRDPQKSKPGRTFKISDSNLNAIGGSLSRDLYQDACAFEEVLGQEEDAERWREWPLLASDGDTALLIELVSENRVNFGIDTSNPRAARSKIDWNSKKTDDDDIETTIQVKFLDVASGTRQPSVADLSVEPPVGILDLQAQATGFEHGKAVDGGPACCRRDSAGLTDCVACLEEMAPVLLLELPTEEAAVVQQTLVLLRDAASDGLTKGQLLAHLHPLPKALIFSAISRMVDAPIPLAHWTGYTSIVLVSAAHIRPWTVMISESEGAKIMIFPRRWLDITGRKMGDVWDAALRAVIGVILLRPGVSQSEIRWRLRSVYDRQEVNDLLQYLHAEGFIKTRVDVGARLDTVPPDDREEKVIFWFLGDIKHWYQV